MSSSAAAAANRRLLEAMCLLGFGAFITFAVLMLNAQQPRLYLPGLGYGSCLFFCCLCSLLHDINRERPLRTLLKRLDHSAIFLLIAGTYTPFLCSGAARSNGLSPLAWIWALATFGIVLRLLIRERYEALFIVLYLALGWFFLLTMPTLLALTPPITFDFLAAGGVAFTCGAAIYWHYQGRWADTIWHGFVLAGILLHFCAVLCLTLGTAT